MVFKSASGAIFTPGALDTDADAAGETAAAVALRAGVVDAGSAAETAAPETAAGESTLTTSPATPPRVVVIVVVVDDKDDAIVDDDAVSAADVVDVDINDAVIFVGRCSSAGLMTSGADQRRFRFVGGAAGDIAVAVAGRTRDEAAPVGLVDIVVVDEKGEVEEDAAVDKAADGAVGKMPPTPATTPLVDEIVVIDAVVVVVADDDGEKVCVEAEGEGKAAVPCSCIW